MRRKFFFLIFAVGGVLVLLIFWQIIRQNFALQGEASLKSNLDSFTQNRQVPYSFYQDSDLDSLSNAKEKIYGTSPLNPDTDGDGYLDGDEVAHGYNPLVAGDAKLVQRKNLSITIQYFLWARREKKLADPKLDQNLINDFFNARPGLTTISLIKDNSIHIIADNSPAAIRGYLAGLNKISLPEGMVSYQKIARHYSSKNINLLKDLLNKIELAEIDLKSLKTPPAAKEIQRRYLTIIKAFYNMFSDLQYYQKDPLKIELNVRKAQALIQLSQEAEALKLELIKKYHIS